MMSDTWFKSMDEYRAWVAFVAAWVARGADFEDATGAADAMLEELRHRALGEPADGAG